MALFDTSTGTTLGDRMRRRAALSVACGGVKHANVEAEATVAGTIVTLKRHWQSCVYALRDEKCNPVILMYAPPLTSPVDGER